MNMFTHRLELNQKQSVEDRSTIADLKSSITLLQEAVEKYKKEMQSIENDKVLLVSYVVCKILSQLY